MESLYLLIPLSVLAVGVAVGVFFWMNNDGQFDDDQGPAWSILLDDDRVTAQEENPRGDVDVGADVDADADADVHSDAGTAEAADSDGAEPAQRDKADAHMKTNAGKDG